MRPATAATPRPASTRRAPCGTSRKASTTGSFNLFYLLQNPGSQAAQVEVRYLRPTPLAPIVKTYTVGAASRRTIYVNREDPALGETDVSAVVTSLNGVPIIAERAMYYERAGPGLRRRPRGGRHRRAVDAVVPRRGRDRPVLQPVHPGGESDGHRRRSRVPLPADRRPDGHAPAHGGAEQPAHDRRPHGGRWPR